MLEELEERVARYPADRYPVQHATARFHLGVALTNAGRAEEAAASLAEAARLFEALPVERAKALNALGAALRELGSVEEAARAFADAAATFEQAELPAELGAAVFNLALAQREAGDERQAVAGFRRARTLLELPAPARELGATLLLVGDVEEAAEVLEEAVERAERAGGGAELGAAWNTLGLARLAVGRVDGAVAAFRAAAGAHPRSVRLQEHAMAKANLALAYEQAGDDARARLAAAQARAVPGVAGVVREQAESVLGRLGQPAGDLLRVLEREPRERWAALVRDECLRWLDEPDDVRRAEAAALAGAAAADSDLADAWLGSLLELPPEQLEALVAAAAPALDERGRAAVSAAMARFHAPQLLRLRETFERIAGGSWR